MARTQRADRLRNPYRNFLPGRRQIISSSAEGGWYLSVRLGPMYVNIWADFAAFLGFGSALMVGGSWLLSFASLTIPGQLAQKVRNVPVPSEPEKETLLANPANGKYLIQFLVDRASCE